MLLVAFMTGNPILQLLFGLCFIVATWVSLAGLGLRQQADQLGHQPQRFLVLAGDDQLVAERRDGDGRSRLGPLLAVAVLLRSFLGLVILEDDVLIGRHAQLRVLRPRLVGRFLGRRIRADPVHAFHIPPAGG